MGRNTVLLFVVSASYSVLIAATVYLFFRIRRDYRQLSLVNELLVKAARPPRGAALAAIWIGMLFLPAIFVLDYLEDPAGMRPILGLLGPLGLLLFVWLQLNFQRLRALETIVRISRPDIYAEISNKRVE